MIPISDLLQDEAEADALSVRMTGRTLAAWDEEWARRRVNGILSRRLNGSKLHTRAERDAESRYYGLHDDAFEAVVASTGTGDLSLPEEMRGLEVILLSDEEAREMIEGHQFRATQSCPPLRAVLLYRIRQSALSRIAAEPRPVQEPRFDY
jgi:hypothetical protein